MRLEKKESSALLSFEQRADGTLFSEGSQSLEQLTQNGGEFFLLCCE